MKRYVMVALVALLCIVWGREASAFVPCETSTRYLCAGRCQALASDSPESAEVQVCGDNPSTAAADAVYELLLQWECAVLDEGAPGPQDDLSCYECFDGDFCHPQGGLLPDGSPSKPPANQGGLIGDAVADLVAGVMCLSSLGETCAPPEPHTCSNACSWYCTGVGAGQWGGLPAIYFLGATVTGSCFSTPAAVEAAANASFATHQVSVAPSMTQCAQTHTTECDDPEEAQFCPWYCEGWTYPLPESIAIMANETTKPSRLPQEHDPDEHGGWTEVWAPCSEGAPPPSAGETLAKTLAETIWRQILNADGFPWTVAEINKAATDCYENAPPY